MASYDLEDYFNLAKIELYLPNNYARQIRLADLGFARSVDVVGDYLKIDQTTPDTVINGSPIFDEGWISSSNCDLTGNLLIHSTIATDGILYSYTNGHDAWRIRSGSADYSQLGIGINTTSGYAYIQSTISGAGTALPISFWVRNDDDENIRAWTINNDGSIVSGSDGTAEYRFTTAGTGAFGSFTSDGVGVIGYSHASSAVVGMSLHGTSISGETDTGMAAYFLRYDPHESGWPVVYINLLDAADTGPARYLYNAGLGPSILFNNGWFNYLNITSTGVINWYNPGYGGLVDTNLYRSDADLLKTDDALQVVLGFGCNSKTAQTAYASGGALSAYVAGTKGFDTDAHCAEVYTLVTNIRAALVANGIMS